MDYHRSFLKLPWKRFEDVADFVLQILTEEDHNASKLLLEIDLKTSILPTVCCVTTEMSLNIYLWASMRCRLHFGLWSIFMIDMFSEFCYTIFCEEPDDDVPVSVYSICKNQTSCNNGAEQNSLKNFVFVFRMQPQRHWTIMFDLVNSSVFNGSHCPGYEIHTVLLW